MTETQTFKYVTVMPAAPRSGWIAAVRIGSLIEHLRLENASIHDREAARTAALKAFPGYYVWVQGDDMDARPWLPAVQAKYALAAELSAK